MKSWPFVLPGQLIVGDPDASVAIVTGWTRREMVWQELEEAGLDIMYSIAAIGQLYTQERGIDMLVRNLLANPNIRTLVLTGSDRAEAMHALTMVLNPQIPLVSAFGSSGNYYTVQGTKVKIRQDIPMKDLTDLAERIRVKVVGLDALCVKVGSILRTVQQAEKENRTKGPRIEPVYYAPPVPEVQTVSGPACGHVIRAKTVAEAYLEMVYQIMTFGTRVGSHYDQDTMEMLDLTIVVTDEDPLISNVPEFIPFDYDHLEAYRQGLMSPEPPPEGVTYLYGHMMRAHFGIDQIDIVARKLAKSPDSRSAVISLWDPVASAKGSPCINHIHWRIRDDKLYMTLTIRSNDMLFGWPENAYGFRYVQERVRQMILKYMGSFQKESMKHHLELGDMVIISQSAHIYADGWDHALGIVKTHRRPTAWWDERGEFVFGRRPGEFHAQLLEPYGFESVHLVAKSSSGLRKQIADRRLVTDIGHALWVGYELGRLHGNGPERDQG